MHHACKKCKSTPPSACCDELKKAKNLLTRLKRDLKLARHRVADLKNQKNKLLKEKRVVSKKLPTKTCSFFKE